MVPAPAPAPTQANKNGLEEWLKQQLKATGRILSTLAEKAAIVGNFVSWVLRTLVKPAGWLTENLWAIAIAVVGLMIMVVREWSASCTTKREPQRK